VKPSSCGRFLATALVGAMFASTFCVVDASAAQPAGRVIVQLRSGSPLASKQVQDADRARTLSARTGAPLQFRAGPSSELSTVHAEGIASERLAELLAAQPEVAFAVPDRRKGVRAVPNDPLYAQQWLLQNGQPSAIDAQGAWDISTGSPNVVVAIVDTGVRPDHEDLRDRLVPGHDFITDAKTAGDGDGRDADPSDPGDFLSAEDLLDPEFAGCGAGSSGNLPTTSSWHGTRVSGVVAASGNNSRGLAGVSWASRLLPARALGKCGGFDSDILAAMRWAGGLPVPDVGTNPNPARIVNLSLGGPGACSAPYQQTIAELRGAGVLVVVAAGNNSGPVEEPANCPGALTVGGLRHTGTKVGYSSAGPEVAIAAPAGNCGDAGGDPCLFQIPTTTNIGPTTPRLDGYSDILNPTIGTSFSAPLASGTAALMLSVHPQLSPESLFARMREAAAGFPQQAGLPQCPQTDPVTSQCNCTTTSCGAGMLDARAAVVAALRPQARVSNRLNGETMELDGAASSASAGRTITAWRWSFVSGPADASFGAPRSATTGFFAAVPGDYRVALTVEDSTGEAEGTQFAFTLAAPSVAPPPPPAVEEDSGSGGGGGGGGAVDAGALAGLALLAALGYAAGPRRPRHSAGKAARVPPR
jgi:serine protease